MKAITQALNARLQGRPPMVMYFAGFGDALIVVAILSLIIWLV